ncbi:hypothetical protein JCM10450v2_002811 [Rhodotorula kratochvilovae]
MPPPLPPGGLPWPTPGNEAEIDRRFPQRQRRASLVTRPYTSAPVLTAPRDPFAGTFPRPISSVKLPASHFETHDRARERERRYPRAADGREVPSFSFPREVEYRDDPIPAWTEDEEAELAGRGRRESRAEEDVRRRSVGRVARSASSAALPPDLDRRHAEARRQEREEEEEAEGPQRSEDEHRGGDSGLRREGSPRPTSMRERRGSSATAPAERRQEDAVDYSADPEPEWSDEEGLPGATFELKRGRSTRSERGVEAEGHLRPKSERRGSSAALSPELERRYNEPLLHPSDAEHPLERRRSHSGSPARSRSPPHSRRASEPGNELRKSELSTTERWLRQGWERHPSRPGSAARHAEAKAEEAPDSSGSERALLSSGDEDLEKGHELQTLVHPAARGGENGEGPSGRHSRSHSMKITSPTGSRSVGSPLIMPPRDAGYDEWLRNKPARVAQALKVHRQNTAQREMVANPRLRRPSSVKSTKRQRLMKRPWLVAGGVMVVVAVLAVAGWAAWWFGTGQRK